MCLSPLQSYCVSVLKCMMCIKCQHVCMRIGLFPGRGGDWFTNRPLSQVIGSSRMTVRYMRWQVAKMAEKKLISLPATLLFSLWWHVAFVFDLCCMSRLNLRTTGSHSLDIFMWSKLVLSKIFHYYLSFSKCLQATQRFWLSSMPGDIK